MKRIAILAAALLSVPAWAEAPAAVAVSAIHQRELVIEGGRNFRDVGGYRTADGRTVKWNTLYRSGSLGSLTARGMARIDALRIGSIIDLRSTDERRRDATNWLPLSGHGYWSRDYGLSQGDMGRLFGNGQSLTADAVRQMMIGAYRTMPREQVPGYRELFARLVAGKGPVVVNCTAGKDRTGIASALVLTALGVPYEAVRADFLLSNGAHGMETLQGSLSGPLTRLPPEVARPLVGVDGEYLDAAFAQLRQDYGSVEGYLAKELGVGPNEIARLRRRMLD